MRIPETMRAAVVTRPGGPDVLKLRELPVPSPGPDEVLIAVHTAGVGSWDSDIRGGWWPEGKPPKPLVLGTDGSGKVAALGSRVLRLRVGQPVIAYDFGTGKGGFYAEYAAVPAAHVAPKPPELDLRRAGSVPATGLTALQGVADTLDVRRGETVLVHGASGGVGALAIQFARGRGARVLGTATVPRALARMRRLGVVALNGKSRRLGELIREHAPEGVHAILALVGGPSLRLCLDALRRGGRVAYPNGVDPAPRERRGLRLKSYDAVPGVKEFAALTRAIRKARLAPPIERVFPLSRAAAAHRRLEAGHLFGRIVLAVR